MQYNPITAKKRKFLERSEPIVLVAFGKHTLSELVKLIGTDREIEAITAPLNSPPVYRRVSICTKEEIEVFKAYVKWIENKVDSKGRIICNKKENK